jgi:hypothetical protein
VTSVILVFLSSRIPALGQSAADLAAKYPSLSAYEVRPGILMTAKYTEDGQVCEMVLEARHYQTPQNIDFGSVIPAKLEDRLIDELVPTSERGEPKHRWSNKEPKDAWVDPDSFIAGGRSYTKRSYENVTVEEHGYYACHENPYSKPKGNLDCSEGGDEVVVIRWTKRSCTVGKSNGSMREIPEGNGRATAGEGARDRVKSEAEKEAGAGESPDGNGLSTLSGEKFLPIDDSAGDRAVTGIRSDREIKSGALDAQRGPNAQAGSNPENEHFCTTSFSSNYSSQKAKHFHQPTLSPDRYR